MTQTELARAAGRSPSSICNYETGIRERVSVGTLIALADALDVSMDELLGREVVKNELGATGNRKESIEVQQEKIGDRSRNTDKHVQFGISEKIRSLFHRRTV